MASAKGLGQVPSETIVWFILPNVAPAGNSERDGTRLYGKIHGKRLLGRRRPEYTRIDKR